MNDTTLGTQGVGGIGHNKPPTPFETAVEKIEDLYGEAMHWLDGEPIDNQGMADSIGMLMKKIRDARKEADDSRKAEVKPLNEAKTEIQARYNPLLQKADLAKDTCARALTPWLEMMALEKERVAREAREAAEIKEAAARAAFQASQVDDLAARAEAELLADEAKTADIRARVAAKDTAKVQTGGRAASLRSAWTPTITDGIDAIRHYWPENQDEFEVVLLRLAQADVRMGKREIPGFEIKEVKTVV